jgi:hypothetical protein
VTQEAIHIHESDSGQDVILNYIDGKFKLRTIAKDGDEKDVLYLTRREAGEVRAYIGTILLDGS